jgi:hypothetical protein
MHGIRVSLDERALEDIGLSKDAALTLTLKDLPLRSVLSLVVRPLGLAWTADRDGVWITTPEGFQSKLELISYPLDEWKAGGQIDALIAVITATIAPQAWDRVGGPGSVRAGIRGTLDVRQTFPVQLQISGLLADLRAAREAGSR